MKKFLVGVLLVLVIVIAVSVGGGFWLYTGNLTSFKQTVFTKLNLPAAIVAKNFIPMRELLARYAIAATNPDTSKSIGEPAAREQILDKLINDEELAVVAQRYNVSVSQTELEREYKDLVAQIAQGNESAFVQAVKQRSGLDKDAFILKVIKPLAIKEQLQLWYNNQASLNEAVYAKIDKLKQDIEGGADMAKLAKENSEDDASKEFAGDVGFVNTADLLPEFSKGLESAAIGSTVIIHSRHGHHLVRVVAKDAQDAPGGSKIHLQEIYFKPQGFDDWYARQIETIYIKKLINFN